MSDREKKARCDQCRKIGHFKKNCPDLKKKMKFIETKSIETKSIETTSIEIEPIILTEIVNEDEIKSFLNKCFLKNDIEREIVLIFDLMV